MRKRPMLLPQDGGTPVQFLHIDELYQFTRLVLAHPYRSLGQVFNVGNPDVITFKDLVELLAEVAGVKATTVPVAYAELSRRPRDFFPFRDYPCVLDIRKAERELAWKPPFDLRTGFHQTLTTYDRGWLATRPIDTLVEDDILDRLVSE